MSTKKTSHNSKTQGSWTTPVEQLFTEIGLPLPTGNKTGGFIMPAQSTRNLRSSSTILNQRKRSRLERRSRS